jgi:hypothetical protein
MPFYLFKSSSDDLVRAITTDPDGAALPRSLAPWVRLPTADGLMERVEAVSDEIQEALDARGYHLTRFGSSERPRQDDPEPR